MSDRASRPERSSCAGSNGWTVSVLSASDCATAWGTCAASATGASSTSQAPSAKSPKLSAAICSARRVLPLPPGPVSVSKRVLRSRCFTSAICWARPIKLVSCTGKLCRGAGLRLASGTRRWRAASTGVAAGAGCSKALTGGAASRPSSAARTSACRLLVTPSLLYRFWMWNFTELIATLSCSAISGAEKPSDRKTRISLSRRVSGSTSEPLDWLSVVVIRRPPAHLRRAWHWDYTGIFVDGIAFARIRSLPDFA